MERRALLEWYTRSGRDLPWRRTRDTYAVWVSEAMCQQTQVATALPYYERWMARFPTVVDLARAPDESVLALWSGLGYYRRCRMLLEAARIVEREGWPDSAARWRELPGVGEYTAAAIASIALREPAAAVDGNVERVFARYSGNDQAGSTLRASAKKWAQENLDRDEPGDWNQALMELGATVCTPRRPRCGECPVAGGCASLAQANFHRPAKRSKQMHEVVHHVWAIVSEGGFAAAARPHGVWWAGLYAFPFSEAAEPPVVAGAALPLASFRHVVTRHRVQLYAWLLEAPCPDGFEPITGEQLRAVAMPAPHRRVLAAAEAALAGRGAY